MQTSTGTAVRTDPMGRVTRPCRASPAADATAALPQPQRARQVRTRWWQGALTPRQSLVPHQVCATGRTPAKRLRPQAGTQKKNHGGEMATYLTTMVTAGVWTKQRSDGGSTAAGIDERDKDDRRHDGRTWWRRPRQTTGLDRWPRDRAATAVVSNQSQLSYSRLTTIVLVDSSEEIRQELKETHLICLFSHTHFMFPWMTIFLRTPP